MPVLLSATTLLRKEVPLRSLGKTNARFFLIHGDSDDFVPTSMLQKNYDAVRSTKEKWVVKNTRHANAYYTHPKEYARKVGKFFCKYLD